MEPVETVSWIEPYRRQFPLVIPLRDWKTLLWRPVGRYLILLAATMVIWIGIVWLLRDCLPQKEAHRFIADAPIFFAALFLTTIGGYFIFAASLRLGFHFGPPRVEVSKRGIRSIVGAFPYFRLRDVAIVETDGRSYLRYIQGGRPRHHELPPEISVAQLRAVLECRDPHAKDLEPAVFSIQAMLAVMTPHLAMLVAGAPLLTSIYVVLAHTVKGSWPW